MNFEITRNFEKDMKKLKKYKSLKDDLEMLKKVLRNNPSEKGNQIVRIDKLGSNVKIPVYKVKQFYCRDIGKGNRSGIRIVYAYIKSIDTIYFFEIFHKKKKENHNTNLIVDYCMQIQKKLE